MKTYKSLISKFGISALALAIAVGFVVAANVALAGSCWCCANGKVGYMPMAKCQQFHGHCYPTESDARRACTRKYNESGGPHR